MNEEIVRRLIEEAKEVANRNFCCKTSHFTVGAALLTKEGKVYKGCNIENDGIQSICAERVAFIKALSEGNKEFSCIVVLGKLTGNPLFEKTLPCGYCRQFISEYTEKDFKIYTYDEKTDKIETYTIDDLLPESFHF